MSENGFGEVPPKRTSEEIGSQKEIDAEKAVGDQIIGFLDMNDPEDKAWAEEIEETIKELREEIRKICPTPDSAIEPYRQGMLTLDSLRVAFTDEEEAFILEECRKRNKAEQEEK